MLCVYPSLQSVWLLRVHVFKSESHKIKIKYFEDPKAKFKFIISQFRKTTYKYEIYFNPLNPSGSFMRVDVLTFHKCTVCMRKACMCFVWFPQNTYYVPLQNKHTAFYNRV